MRRFLYKEKAAHSWVLRLKFNDPGEGKNGLGN